MKTYVFEYTLLPGRYRLCLFSFLESENMEQSLVKFRIQTAIMEWLWWAMNEDIFQCKSAYPLLAHWLLLVSSCI